MTKENDEHSDVEKLLLEEMRYYTKISKIKSNLKLKEKLDI